MSNPYLNKLPLVLRPEIRRILDHDGEWKEFVIHAIEHPIPNGNPIKEEIVVEIENHVEIEKKSPTEKMLKELGRLGYHQSDLLHWANIDGRFKQIANIIEERGRRRSLPSTPTGNQERSLIAASRVLQRSQSCSYSTTAPGKPPKMDSIEEAEVSSSLITPGKPPKVNSIEEAEVSSSLITPGKPPKVNSIEEAEVSSSLITPGKPPKMDSIEETVKLLSPTRSENSDNKPREVSLIGEGDTREDRKIDTQQRRTEEMQSSTPSKLFKPNEDSKDLTESGVPRSGGKQRDVTLLRVRGSGEDRRTEVRRRQTGIKWSSTPEGIQEKVTEVGPSDVQSDRKMKITNDTSEMCQSQDKNQRNMIYRFLPGWGSVSVGLVLFFFIFVSCFLFLVPFIK